MDFKAYPYLAMFKSLPESELALLEIRSLAAREYLMREELLEDMCLYLLLEGMCVGEQIAPRDKLFSAYKILPGEFIGLSELLQATPTRRGISILTKTPVKALCIPGKVFLRWQTAYGALYNHIIATVLEKHFTTRDLLFNCVAQRATVAGAYYLAYLYQAYHTACHEKGYAGPVKIGDSHTEIAAALARDVRSVDRVIHKLKQMGLLETNKGKVEIDARQAKALQAFADNG